MSIYSSQGWIFTIWDIIIDNTLYKLPVRWDYINSSLLVVSNISRASLSASRTILVRRNPDPLSVMYIASDTKAAKASSVNGYYAEFCKELPDDTPGTTETDVPGHPESETTSVWA